MVRREFYEIFNSARDTSKKRHTLPKLFYLLDSLLSRCLIFRYKERVGSIRRELQGAKSIAEDYRVRGMSRDCLDVRVFRNVCLGLGSV